MREAWPCAQNVHLDILNKAPERDRLFQRWVRPRGRILAIVICPGCSHKLRIPDGKRGTVTCRLCGAEWFHPNTLELSDVEFRCSMSGARFNVISSRRSPLHKFVIQKIQKPVPEPTRSSEADPPPAEQQPSFEAVTPSLTLAAPQKVGRWLAGIMGRKADGISSQPPASVPKDRPVNTTAPIATHSIDEYNWSGFSCPYCNASSFVSCAGGHLACDGTAKLRDGRRFHQCFCGQAGFITETIKTLESKRLSVEANVGSPAEPPQSPSSISTDIALSPPPDGRPLAKR
jgi:transcription elongation factor Elf1